jgi:putative aldouronate transport system permease protein
MKKNKMKRSWDDRLYDWICNILLILFIVIVAYPLWFVVMASVSDPIYVNNGTFLLYPKGFTLDGYKLVFGDMKVWTGYLNTIIYAVFGTLFGLFVTILAGYALSRKDLVGRSVILKLMVFTMFFNGGTIPLYLVIQKLGLLDTRMLIIMLGSVTVYNIIIVRSFMESSIPDELLEAAKIDGCGNGKFFVQIVLPLSKAVVAVIALYVAVAHWNSYFNSMMYLTDGSKHPLQLYLREILVLSSSLANGADVDPELQQKMEQLTMIIKYAAIVVSTAPILCVYPFVQKYFVKGVMIGSVKG